jgi:spore germination protein
MGLRCGVVIMVFVALLAGVPARATAAAADPPVTDAVAYLVPWDRAGGMASIAAAAGLLTEVSPWAYALEEDGDIGFTQFGDLIVDDTTLIELRSRGLAVTPSIANKLVGGKWDDARVRAIIADPVRTQRHIDAIVALVLAKGYDGIDIDYEGLGQQPGDRADFTRFITGLAAALHAQGRTLSVAVYGKRNDAGDSDGAKAQDYAALGAVVDQVRIMLYDFNPAVPGAIAPWWWLQEVLAYAVSTIPAERVIQGVGLYGYGWPGPDGPDEDDEPDGPEEFTWAGAVGRAAAEGVPVEWDVNNLVPRFTTTDPDQVVYFEDSRSTGAKLDLGRSYGVGGVMFWRLGGEDPATWSTAATRLGLTRWINRAPGRPLAIGGTGATAEALNRATDGVIDTHLYANLSASSPQWLRIDLGTARRIRRIAVWHYFADARSYRDVIVQVSNRSDFSTSPSSGSALATLFNNNADGTAGQGVGRDAAYPETSLGRSIDAGGLRRRYVRLWSNGNSVNPYNHYVEVHIIAD